MRYVASGTASLNRPIEDVCYEYYAGYKSSGVSDSPTVGWRHNLGLKVKVVVSKLVVDI